MVYESPPPKPQAHEAPWAPLRAPPPAHPQSDADVSVDARGQGRVVVNNLMGPVFMPRSLSSLTCESDGGDSEEEYDDMGFADDFGF